MRKLALAVAVVLLSGCAITPRASKRPAFYPVLATSPAEVDAYLKENVDPATLRKWDKRLSDSTVIIDVVSPNGNESTVGVAK